MTRRPTEILQFAAAVSAVALGASLFAVCFRALLAAIYLRLYHAPNIVDAFIGLPRGLRLVWPLLGGISAGLLAQLFAARRQGVSSVMEAVALGRVSLSLRTTLRRVSASFVAIASGISIGREGPLIEFGGSLGASIGRLVAMPLSRTRVLVAAGTAAGFAAAYNTPFAAVLFVLETIVGIAALEAVVPILAATVIATAVTRALVGGGPIYGQRAFAVSSLWEFVSFAAVGVLSGLGGVIFKRALKMAERMVARWEIGQPWRGAAGGVLVGSIALALPQVVGNGFEPLNAILDDRVVPGALLPLALAKIVATSGSVASGIPGGIFTPSLLVGGIIGAEWAHVLTAMNFATSNVGGYALVGMAAATAATIHAPLTAAVLVFELSGDYSIALPLLLATVIATTISRALQTMSIYEAELADRGLRWRLTLEGRELSHAKDRDISQAKTP